MMTTVLVSNKDVVLGLEGSKSKVQCLCISISFFLLAFSMGM